MPMQSVRPESDAPHSPADRLKPMLYASALVLGGAVATYAWLEASDTDLIVLPEESLNAGTRSLTP
ncbi:MAG: hypothetical protein HOY44_01840 [Maritimibacter sp.]|uniref:hypothetical protein n=1 Tax=Maritimibacter sp. TaxID=2003363 RepID=UPI001DB13ACC|nr:hypothetical protein [Maritimibacter sp.]MBL6426247.1 hypothetical protein [Maritimibacter sp.]